MIDETTQLLSGVVKKPGDVLRHLYDFGDDWHHTITLERSLTADEAPALPYCVDGEALAPMEDSGGVWGRPEIVAASRDPSHEHYEDYRDWLGLEPEVQLDATQFEPAQVNEVYDRLSR